MGWDSRGYYYRSKKVGGRVRREYVGRGFVAEACAKLDRQTRQMREVERQILSEQRAELQALDDPVVALNDLVDLVARTALLAAGYHQHNRSEWRKKRGQHDDVG